MKSCAFREIAFIDPAISHLDLFVAGLRPGIEAVLLAARSATRLPRSRPRSRAGQGSTPSTSWRMAAPAN